jgi:hypothetical protein
MTLHLASRNEQTKHSGPCYTGLHHTAANKACCSGVRSSLGLGAELPSQGHAWRSRAESSGSLVCTRPPIPGRFLRTKNLVLPWFPTCSKAVCRAQWRWSAAARLLRFWVRIPKGGNDVLECYVLSGRGLCFRLITRPEDSYKLCCVVVCDLETSLMRRSQPTEGCCAKK